MPETSTTPTPNAALSSAGIAPHHIQKLARYEKLRKLRSYFTSKQYEGRADFFTGTRGPGEAPVPLRQRAPCVVYPLPKASVDQVVKFTFGESRFPTVNVVRVEDEDDALLGIKVSDDEADKLETFIANLVDRALVKPTMRRIMRPGLAVGTVCAIVSVKRGSFVVTVANAEDCLPTFRNNDPDDEVLRLTWCYQFKKTVPGPNGEPQQKMFWFRQDVDAAAYYVFDDVEVVAGAEPRWGTPRQILHAFGCCPVRWIRNLPDDSRGDIDGQSLYEGLLEEFDALNFTLSQRHRGIHNFGTPQPYETGVEEDDGPGASGRVSTPGYSAPTKQSGGAPYGGVVTSPTSGAQAARKGGPDQIWSYQGKDVQVGLVETTGKAFETATLHVDDIRSRILESMSVVLVSLSDIMNKAGQRQMSAKFLELAYEPLLALVDEMRHFWWPNGLEAILSLMLRCVANTGGKGILIPGAESAAAVLSRFFVKLADNTTEWVPPRMTPNWGDYFSAGAEEIGQAIDAATKAKDSGLVPCEDAIKFVLPYFGREDTHDAIKEIEEEDAERQAKADAAQKAETERLHALAGGKPNDESGAAAAGRDDAPAAPGSRGGAVSADDGSAQEDD